MPSPTPKDPDRGTTRTEDRDRGAGNAGADPARAFAMMNEDDSADRREGLEVDDSTPLSSNDTPSSSDFDSSFGHSSAVDTVEEPDSTGGGTAGVASEVLRAQAGDGGGGSLPDPNASSARQPSLVGPRSPDRLFRPQLRPPTPVLRVMDDDQQGFEELRLRSKAFTLGRVHGELTFGNDRVMSSRHARITLETNKATGEKRWMLQDLGSVNGTFLRVPEVPLSDRERLWLGGDLIRVSLNKKTGELTLVELKTENPDRATLRPGVHWVGLGSGCVEFLKASPFLDDRGFSAESDAAGRWRLIDHDSTNGLWRSIDEEPVELAHDTQFKLGEQHFIFKLP